MFPDIVSIGAANEAVTVNPQARVHAEQPRLDPEQAVSSGKAASASDRLQAKKPVDAKQDNAKAAEAKAAKDAAELIFTLTPEEQQAFRRYVSSREEGNDATVLDQNDYELVEKAAERIAKAMEETIAMNQQSREKVDKAVSEWYSLLSKGESKSPFELVNLLRAVAMGKYDA